MPSDDETIGQLFDRLPEDVWVDLPEGVRVKRLRTPATPMEPCGETAPHQTHEWYNPALRRQCPGIGPREV